MKISNLISPIMLALVFWTSLIQSGKIAAQVPQLLLDFCTVYGEPGDTVCVPIRGFEFDSLSSMQWSIYHDEHLQFLYVQNITPHLPDLVYPGDFNHIAPNRLLMVWSNLYMPTIPNGAVLYEVCFKILDDAQGYLEIGLSNTPLMIEVHLYYNGEHKKGAITGIPGGVQIGQAPISEIGEPEVIALCPDSTAQLCLELPPHLEQQSVQYSWFTENGTSIETNSDSACLDVTASSEEDYTSYYCEINVLSCTDSLYRSALFSVIEQGEALCQLPNSIRHVPATHPLHLYPNPTSTSFTLTLPAAAPEGMQVRIADMYGRELSLPNQPQIRTGTRQHTLDISHLPAGVYWVSVHRDEGEVHGGKLVVR
jgi:hypothetical protein